MALGQYPDDSPIYGRRDAELRNERNNFHFFEPATMRFFNCRVSDSFYICEARQCSYFVTSERNKSFTLGHNYPRLYTVRRIAWKGGDVDTVGEFQAYRSASTAQRRAKAYSEGEDEPTKEDGDRAALHKRVAAHLGSPS